MVSKGTKRPKQICSKQEKLDAIMRVHAGKTKASVAREIGVPESTIRGWCKKVEKIKCQAEQESAMECCKKRKLDDPPEQPLDLSLKGKPKTTNGHMTESVRNQAELARLRVLLRLNSQGMLMPNAKNNPANLTAFNANSHLWYAMLMHHQQAAMRTGPASLQSMHESDRLRQHSMDNSAHTIATGMHGNEIASSSSSSPTTSTATNPSSPASDGMTADQVSWFWNWHLLTTNFHRQKFLLQQQLPQPRDDEQIWRHQLTGDMERNHVGPPLDNPDQEVPEDLSMRDKKNGMADSIQEASSVWDSFLANNKNNALLKKNGGDAEGNNLSCAEAMEYGENFLNWLESCSDPSVTTVLIMKFKKIINNMKISIGENIGDSNAGDEKE